MYQLLQQRTAVRVSAAFLAPIVIWGSLSLRPPLWPVVVCACMAIYVLCFSASVAVGKQVKAQYRSQPVEAILVDDEEPIKFGVIGLTYVIALMMLFGSMSLTFLALGLLKQDWFYIGFGLLLLMVVFAMAFAYGQGIYVTRRNEHWASRRG